MMLWEGGDRTELGRRGGGEGAVTMVKWRGEGVR